MGICCYYQTGTEGRDPKMTTTATAPKTTTDTEWEHYYTERFEGRDDNESLTWTERCSKCGGNGYIACYAGIDGGICYDCVAKGIPSTRRVTSTVGEERAKDRKRAQRQAAAQRKANRKAAAETAKVEAAVAARIGRYPAMHLFTYEGLQTLPLTEWAQDTLSDLRFKDRQYGLSEKQVEFAARLIDEGIMRQMSAPIEEARKAAAEAAKVPAPEGRMFVTGTVVKAKRSETYFSYTATTVRKLCIEVEPGWTLFVTCSRELEDLGYAAEEAELANGERDTIRRFQEDDEWTKSWWMVGRKVRMNVTIKPSDRDASQGFGTRPTKAELV